MITVLLVGRIGTMVEFTIGREDTTGIADSSWHFDEKRNVLKSSYGASIGPLILGTMFGIFAGLVGTIVGAIIGFFVILVLDLSTGGVLIIMLEGYTDDIFLVPAAIGGIGAFLYQFGQGVLYSGGTHVEEINLNTMKIETFLLLKNGKKAFDEDIQSLGRGGLRIKDDGEYFEIKIGQITLIGGLSHHSVAEQKMEIFRRIIDGEDTSKSNASPSSYTQN